MSYWGNIQGVGNPIPIRAFNGIYKPDDHGFNIDETMFTWLENFGDSAYPALSTVSGYEIMLNFTPRAIGMGVWKDQEIHIITQNGSWMKTTLTSTIWTTIATGLNTTKNWTFCNFKGAFTEVNLIASNGVDPIKRYDGSTVTNLANAPAGGDFICTHSNRLYCAKDNTLYFSALSKADDWTTVDDGGSINVDTTDGEFIIGLNPGIGHLTIFKNSSMHELYGKSPQSYQLDPIALDIGAVNNKSITYHDDVIYFISKDGLYSYSGGLRPTREWSMPVHNIVVDMELALKDITCAAATEDAIYFTLSYKSQIYTIKLNTKTRTFSLMSNISPYDLIRFKDYLYVSDNRGMITRLAGKTNSGTPIYSTAITKPFTATMISKKQEWYKLWVVASLDVGSTITIHISTDGSNWRLVNTISADAFLTFKELLVPLHSVSGAHAVWLKIEAIGYVQIHEIARQTRELPLRR